MFTRLLLKSSQAAVLLVAGIFIGAALSSFAGGSIGIGACRHNGLTEGVWYQDQFGGFKGNRNSPCVEAEWRSEGKRGIALGLAHLGYLRGNNLATINDNSDATKTYTGGNCSGEDGTNCLARYLIAASEYGVTLGAFTKMGRFSLEGGLFFYRSGFTVTVQKIHEASWFPDSREFRIVSYNNTPYVGVVFADSDFYARLRVYQEINQDGAAYPYKGLTSGPVVALTAGVTF